MRKQNPSPELIRSIRKNAGLTQQKSADIVHAGLRTWQQWEAGDRAMGLDAWELFLIKIGIPEFFAESQNLLA